MPFHAEMRSGRSVARGFNLTEEEVRARFLAPLRGGDPFIFQDKKWDPRETRLTIVEGEKLGPGQLSLGQGWTNAVKRGEDVTTRFIAAAPAGGIGTGVGAGPEPDLLARLKERLLGRVAAGPLALNQALAVGADLLVGRRVSERLGAVELAVWELLHAGSLELLVVPDGPALLQDGWQVVLLDPATWLGGDADGPQVRAPGG